ncbi:NADP-dependent oxidoreductase [Pseudonocardia sp. NPDC049154]|uniref:NADP-dependent oxidoreductase n=1 Tax=Pseudonocardia sp. NPDC049154 TaxID=3155501 RepID=UPI0033C4B1F7
MGAWTAEEVRLAHAGGEDLGPESFVLAEREYPDPADGHVLVRVRYASLDPSHRIRLRHSPAGTVPAAGVVGEVVASASTRFAVGDLVTGSGTWSNLAVLAEAAATPYTPPPGVPDHHAVGILGLTGLTAYFGVTRVLRPEPGEKIVVSGAYGGVGQVACRLAALAGAEVLGVAGGGDRKVQALRAKGIEAVDYRAADFADRITAWAPDGADGYFDNVWGETSARVVERLRPLGRVALCGQMSAIGEHAVPPLPLDDWFVLVTRSLRILGFRAADYASENATAVAELGRLLAEGKLDQDLHLVRGWAEAGAAFADMVAGRTFGKLVVDAT